MRYSVVKIMSSLVIGIFFSACGVKSLDVKQIVCTKEDINECKQEDKLFAVKKNPELIKYIEKPNQEVQLEAVSQDAKLIRYIERPNKEVQIKALEQDASVIEFIKKPSKEALRY